MTNARENLYAQIAVLVLIVSALVLLIRYTAEQPRIAVNEPIATSTQSASVSATETTTPPPVAVEATSSKPAAALPKKKRTTLEKTSNTATMQTPAASAPRGDAFIARIENPYATPSLPLASVNSMARGALVNILCTTSGGLLSPISGSGTIIDPRGVILTNAHVAQYVLLAESSRVNLMCYIRTGSPATAQWLAKVLYVPPVWVEAHAKDILAAHPVGTGEHDYALLFIYDTATGAPLPERFPYLQIDTRHAIGFVDDPVVVASYPAEFVGGLATANNLYAASSITDIKQLLTFGTQLADALSLGGVIGAQSGSSGGAVVNAWGRLIGVITTTSEGKTTSERDLRAISLNYIERDIKAQSGSSLEEVLAADPESMTVDFTTRAAPRLIDLLLKEVFKNR